MELTVEEFVKLKFFIMRMLKASDDIFDKAYTVAKDRGDDMNIWFRVGHDLARNKATIKYCLEEFEKKVSFNRDKDG